MRDNGDVEVSLHHLQAWYKPGCSLQEGVDQSGQPGNIFTSVLLWMQWERGGEAAFQGSRGSAAHPHCPWRCGTEHHPQLLLSAGICVSSSRQLRNSCASISFPSFLVGTALYLPVQVWFSPCSWLWLWAQPGTGKGTLPMVGSS